MVTAVPSLIASKQMAHSSSAWASDGVVMAGRVWWWLFGMCVMCVAVGRASDTVRFVPEAPSRTGPDT